VPSEDGKVPPAWNGDGGAGGHGEEDYRALAAEVIGQERGK